jgi:hypothetical protein
MKKSAKVTLTVVATIGLASCGRGRRDPCEPAYFNELACQEAVSRGGYYWGGSWYPMTYSYPYPYYYDSYHTYVVRGGSVSAAPVGSYSAPSGSSVQRGGFGSTGVAHGSSSGSGSGSGSGE